MNKSKDVGNIQYAISMNEGVIACEISLEKKEIRIIYNESIVDLNKITDSIENLGYIITLI
jgi:copper chaperone CopZ